MTELQADSGLLVSRTFLPLGSVVILNGSVKKLVIVSRGSIFEDTLFDYGAILYPEGLIDTNIAYFNQDDIMKTVHEGYRDTDDELAVDVLNDARTRFQQKRNESVSASVPVASAARAAEDDPFASVRDLGDDDE
ncbi:hypothetical protein C5C18_14910 [Rathayibacter tritici]|uniref:DUF4176 domain-containing protein n=1 Tax=Rathayibacter tritici TaxID=33888 RepID=UPI000CE8ADC0|nr:DUF4176 domain-containing protein [Rathayibacter tritici]PPF62124.1 hypothetical protein C5C21_14560 [Rathayibacter tritici]PPG02114.1 hypothetical protein C5C18_14910 [Rathayibacter tritici]